jgi:hypothetical protein
MVRARLLLLPVLCAVVVGAAGAAPAQGMDWEVRQLQGEPGLLPLYGISCPTATFCAAVGGNNILVTSTNPGGGLPDWHAEYLGSGPTQEEKGFFNGHQVRGVSCPTPGLCVAVTFDGLIYSSTNPTGGNAAWQTVDVDGQGPNTHMYGISCPTVSFCAASAGKGKIVTTTNPAGDASAWTKTTLPQPLELRGISCSSAYFCVAVGDDGVKETEDGQIVTSTNPLSGAWDVTQAAGAQGSMFGVSCPSPALCASGNAIGNLAVSTNPTGGPAAWDTFDGGGSVQITAASCISTSLCVAVDDNGDVLTSKDPTRGASAWSFTNLIPYSTDPNEFSANAIWGVSCPTVTFCAASASRGKIITLDEPLAQNHVPVKKKKRRRAPKRPKTTIAATPGPANRTRGGTFKAHFRFFANGRVRRFVCKIDGGRFRACHSPTAYRVRAGLHVFRVRAIGLTGLRGPTAKATFHVFTPRQWPPGSPPPGSTK